MSALVTNECLHSGEGGCARRVRPNALPDNQQGRRPMVAALVMSCGDGDDAIIFNANYVVSITLAMSSILGYVLHKLNACNYN